MTDRTHNRDMYVKQAGPYADFVREMVESGRYDNAADVILAGLELLRDEELQRAAGHEWLKGEIKKGVESGPGRRAEEVFAQLRERIGTVAK
jgi:antitoxin ParD1/3/4